MSFIPENWAKFENSGFSIYLHRHRASWFVPNNSGSFVIERFSSEKKDGLCAEECRLIKRLPDSSYEKYEGREHYLKTDEIRELWLHITDNCNLECSHCLFSSSPESRASISFSAIKDFINEAFSLGCRMFVLTGGEPFVHPDILNIIRFVTDLQDCHVAVLTNGILKEKMLLAKKISPERVHFQISLDGLKDSHDNIRGDGSFDRTMSTIGELRKEGFAYTLSMCVTESNYKEMPVMVQLASDCGAENLHFMWYFVKGRGDNFGFADPSEIYPLLQESAEKAGELSVNIDNISELKNRIFSPQGTIHDGSGAAWNTLAIGPDLMLYPSAASIGNKELGVSMEHGLESAWKNAPIMKEIRVATMASLDDPFRFILGGGDFDHSYTSSGRYTGADPYYQMHMMLAVWLIARTAEKYSNMNIPGLALKMGDILETCGEHGSVTLCHSNCLLDVASTDVRSSVASFYAKAASADSEDILNPVCYSDEYIEHIPKKYRFRGYGCGSPVTDADIKEGENVVDLGSGRGIECFIAAKLSGENGRVTGIDMLDPMLEIARQGAVEVVGKLGFDNLDFRKGFLESLPVPEKSTDVVISNCVLNLSPDKRRTFSEIFRILKSGGRLVVSDVVCDEEPDPSVRNDEKLRGECIAGAMTQKDLVGILHESGFESVRLIRRFPYRNVSGHDFFSLTFSAIKPSKGPKESGVAVIYRGPFVSVITSAGTVLHAGIKTFMDSTEAKGLGEDVFVLDDHGSVSNFFWGESSCCCSTSSESEVSCCSGSVSSISCCDAEQPRHMAGCMVCGEVLYYSVGFMKESACSYCGKKEHSSVTCRNGHFVCDSCHAADGLDFIRRYLTSTDEKDLVLMFDTIKSHKSIPMHGPEHHALVAGIIVAAYLNTVARKDESMILEAVERASKIAGGSCGYSGVCGAASGAGTGFAIILGSSPVNPSGRKAVQSIVHEILGEIASFEAARCCQRDGWIALKKSAEISQKFLNVTLLADHVISCKQCGDNQECISDKCPLFN
ncbi:radical SAM protein [Desulforegula conservatrix]|uniref:radical SAM protein n=1 Tax=Desulforegula conservatrix TaxID=153026 RepID=UPI0004081297|nr:radical SAM protein [Desulforegula conservatrix]